MTTPTLSVVMPAFENPGELAVTVPAILNQTLPEGMTHEVVVVDDGSGPAVAEALARIEDARLRVIRLERNSGRSVARNTGIRAARGKWLVLLDSDMIARPDFLAAHAEALAQAEISLGSFVDTDSLAPAEARPEPRSWLWPGMFTSANVGLHRAALARLTDTPDGPFDANTFTRYGWEDTDLDRRLHAIGASRRRAPRAVTFHVAPPFEPGQIPALRAKEIDRAAMARRYLAKHRALSVRLSIQATPLHRAMWEVLSLGGLLNERSLRPLLAWLVRRDRRMLAAIIARLTILNPTYVRHL